jgi:hypothetical protein
MSIVQKNIFGDNIVYSVSPNFTRNLNEELQREILNILKEMDVESIKIRYENGGETNEFSNIIAQFLQNNGFRNIFLQPVLMSEIQRSQFTIEKITDDTNFAMICIGPII